MADVDESQVLGQAALKASTSTANPKKTSKAAKSKASAGGGSSRKRDHDAMIDASQQDQGAAGGTAGSSSTNLLASDSVASLEGSKPQRVLLPKGPGHAQPAQAGQGQEPGGLNPAGQRDPDQWIDGEYARIVSSHHGGAVSSGVRFLTEEAFSWLPVTHRIMAQTSLEVVEMVLFHIWGGFSNSLMKLGFTKENLLQNWDTVLGGWVRVAIAHRDGVQFDLNNFIHNRLTSVLSVHIPQPAHPSECREFTVELPDPKANLLDAKKNSFLPINVDGEGGRKRERVAEITAQIYTFSTLAQRNEDARNKQFSQLSNLLSSQVQAQAQGIGALHAAQSRTDLARDWEMRSIYSLFIKKQQVLDSANEEE